MTPEDINDELKSALNKLETLVSVANKMSGALHGFCTSSHRHTFASEVFARAVIQFRSLLLIAENSQKQDSKNINFPIDIPSIASILRSIVELYRAFHYGAIDNVTDDERELRHLKFKLKSTIDRKTILKKFDSLFSQENEESNSSDTLDEEIIILKTKMKTHKVFASFDKVKDKSKRDKCLSDSAMYLKEDEIEKKAGLEKDSQDAMYRILSSEVHANPLAIEQTAGNITNSEFAQLTLIVLLNYAIYYLKMYILEIAKLFPEHKI